MKTITLNRKQIEQLLLEKNLLSFNRSISLPHSVKLSKSIKEIGVLRYPVIANVSKIFKDKKMSIIDGQHLLKGFLLNKTNKSINCIYKTYNNRGELIKDVSVLNSTHKNWNDSNYLDAWYYYGTDNKKHYHNYIQMYNYKNDIYKGIPIGTLIDIFGDGKTNFRSGKMVFKNIELSKQIADLCLELKIKHKKGSFTLSGLIMEMKTKKYDYNKLRSRLLNALRNGEDKNCNGREDFREFIKTIYNRL
tara:strand:- start:424 stop:1167 length:744 start_codon:yes stop_codon:yes gene_type:complete